ncbi:hypothetical protein FHS61_002425 [Altererythrobacter atlanticus]|uniref:Uncharacterized protein n=1 Tax=Croceibacterium atlanticum TaxID=1267766 RepID=A0A0F7KS00_9SPHN|nr:hypothetical protein [Croceibacterium atlanticum]AKH42042.1 hypothetical protein WYH_00994 [Croceibacterium atlanticum]MBB5733390.1 hypothetical protein [Croceibacterium atlanticum]
MTRFYFTIDTEYEAGHAMRHGKAGRAENFTRSICGRTDAGDVGIFYQMDMFDRCGLKGVFFIDPMPALLWGTAAIADIVGPVVERGHDVQLHIHTEWLDLAGSANPLGSRRGTNIKDFHFEDQCVLIDWARAQLQAAGAPRPLAFRAGNYGANDDTLRALAELGFTHDSSHTPGMAGSACEISLGPDHRRPMDHLGITEVPIGCVGDVITGLRHAQLTALSLVELVAAARHAMDAGLADFTLVSHSFELLCRDRRRINKIVRRRFDLFCQALAAMEGIETACFTMNPPKPGSADSLRPALPPSAMRNGSRMAEQAVSNMLYGSG